MLIDSTKTRHIVRGQTRATSRAIQQCFGGSVDRFRGDVVFFVGTALWFRFRFLNLRRHALTPPNDVEVNIKQGGAVVFLILRT